MIRKFKTGFRKFNQVSSFTLVEMLVVLAVLAVLAAVTVIILNPAEHFKETRDAQRISDLNLIDINLATLTAAVWRTDLGNSNTVYVSLPDSSSNCSSYSLPTLPDGWSYKCVTSANLRKVDGNGWIPVDFTKYPQGTLLSVLPIDPANKVEGSRYYTYVTGGSWALASTMESKKQLEQRARKDGEFDPERFVTGNDITLWRSAYGIAGYWPFNEGTGATAGDLSGNNNSGTLTGSPTWQTESNCKIGKCLSFNGSNNYVNIPNFPQTTGRTYTWWHNISANGSAVFPSPLSHGGYSDGIRVLWRDDTDDKIDTQVTTGSDSTPTFILQSADVDQVGVWYHYAVTYDGVNTGKLYRNGILIDTKTTGTGAIKSTASPFRIGLAQYYWKGLIDDVRVYNRVLSADEISTIYNATK